MSSRCVTCVRGRTQTDSPCLHLRMAGILKQQASRQAMLPAIVANALMQTKLLPMQEGDVVECTVRNVESWGAFLEV